MELIQVSASSPVSAVAGAITSVVLEYRQAEVEAIGEDAANQATQALDLATCCLENNGISVTCETQSSKVMVDHKVSTAVKLIVRQSPNANFLSPGGSVSPRSTELPRV